MESLEAGSDECLEDRVPGRLHLSYSTSLGGSRELQIPRGYETGWVRLKNLARARLRGLETLEAESDECLEDRVLGRLNLSYFTSLGGSGELQIPRGYEPGWVRLKNLARARL